MLAEAHVGQQIEAKAAHRKPATISTGASRLLGRSISGILRPAVPGEQPGGQNVENVHERHEQRRQPGQQQPQREAFPADRSVPALSWRLVRVLVHAVGSVLRLCCWDHRAGPKLLKLHLLVGRFHAPLAIATLFNDRNS